MPDINAEIVGQNQPTSGPSEGSLSIDFGALRAKASEMIDAANARTEQASSAPAPAPTPTEAAPQAETPASVAPEHEHAPEGETAVEAAARKALQFNDDDEIEIVVDGKPTVVSGKDAKSRLSGEFKFTQRMQEVAQQRRELEARQAEITRIQQERDQLVALLNNPQLLGQFAQQAGLLPTEPADPNEIATVGDVQQTIEQRMAALQRATQQQIAQANAQILFQQEQAQHAVAISSTLANVFSQNPVLQAIPHAEDLIRYQVSQLLTPQSTQAEAIEAINAVAQEMVGGIGKHFQTTQKAQRIAEAKQKLVTKTIEPPGGAAPQPTPLNYKNADGTVNWNAIRNAAASMLG